MDGSGYSSQSHVNGFIQELQNELASCRQNCMEARRTLAEERDRARSKDRRIEQLEKDNLDLRDQKPTIQRETTCSHVLLDLSKDVPKHEGDDSLDTETVVLHKHYDVLRKELDETRRNYALMKYQAAQYKSAFESIKGKYDRGKKDIKAWRDYLQNKGVKSPKRRDLPFQMLTPSPSSLRSSPLKASKGKVVGGVLLDTENALKHLTNTAASSLERSQVKEAFSTTGADVPEAEEFRPRTAPATQTATDSLQTERSIANVVKPEQEKRSASEQVVHSLRQQVPIAIPSSQSTEDEIDGVEGLQYRPNVVIEGASNEVEFLSSRPVKRKRGNSALDRGVKITPKKRRVEATHKDGSARVKEESQTQAELLAVLPRLLNNDSLDLDEATKAVDTPRKRIRLQRLLSRIQAQTQRATSEPLETEMNLHRDETFQEKVSQQASQQKQQKGARSNIGRRDSPNKLNEMVEEVAPRSIKADQSRRSSGRLTPVSLLNKHRHLKKRSTPQTDDKAQQVRGRPLDKLRLSDFKINPGFNQGMDFAYSEVVRRKDQRRCMPGCTRPECCGNQFRKIAEMGGMLNTRKSNLWGDSQEDVDQKLLEDFLGDDRDLIPSLGEGERAELLKQAQVQEMAQNYGKHRQVYRRAPTPPGFWRTDMPNTQELERDRERSKQQEREQVEERYREAMRPNGQWKFRDEQ